MEETKKYNLKEEYQEILIRIIKKHLPDCKIYLFGSRSRKTNLPESDIDIALDAKKIIDSVVLGNIKEEIEESKIPFCVDVLDLNNVSEDMKNQIFKEKIEWKN